MARRPHRILIPLAALILLGPGAAWADKGMRPPPRAAQPADAAPPKVAAPKPQIQPLPPLLKPGNPFVYTGFTKNALGPNGLVSPLPPMGDVAAECRTGCARTRITCEAQDGTPECGQRWAQCTATCNR